MLKNNIDGTKIGKNIEELREEKGISRAQLAIRLGVSSKTIYYWESGARTFSVNHLMALSTYLGATTDKILGLTA